MTLTSNREQYALLLTKYQPKVIEIEQEYCQALTVVEYFVFEKDCILEELASSSKSQAKRFGEIFQVSTSLFI
jgi:hypothetical protein